MTAQRIGRARALMSGIGVGAALMYFLDPDRGPRRRALMRDRIVDAMNAAEDAAGTTSRDIADRARGVLQAARGSGRQEDDADTEVEGRLRRELRRLVSYPQAITITAEDGQVTVSGDALAGEAEKLIAHLERMRGVLAVDNRLTVHETSEGVAALQEPPLRGSSDVDGESWTPSARLIGGVAGGLLTMYGVRRRDSFGAAVGLAGLALLTRGTSGIRDVKASGGGGINIRKTFNVSAPIDDVFAFLTDWENLPRWLTHVRHVRATGTHGDAGERTHWEVQGPAGTTIDWDAETTRFVPNELVAWRSVVGARVQQVGRMRFTANADGGTRVQVELSYQPGSDTSGRGVASIFGRDATGRIADDLARLKSRIESGELRAAARASRSPGSRSRGAARARPSDLPPTA